MNYLYELIKDNDIERENINIVKNIFVGTLKLFPYYNTILFLNNSFLKQLLTICRDACFGSENKSSVFSRARTRCLK